MVSKDILGVFISYLQEYVDSYSNKRTMQLDLQFKRKQKPFPQELNYLGHLFFNTALKNGVNLARKLEI